MANTARTRRLLRELILEGKIAEVETVPEEIVEEPPKNKLHLNIRKLLYMFKRVKKAIFFSEKDKEQNVTQSSKGVPKTTREPNEIWGIIKFVVGYGIIGSFVLFLILMLLPLELPLAVWIKGSAITQIIISILGMGSLAYLYYDRNLFVHELRNRGK